MLKEHTVQRIQSLLAEGMSQRRIAEVTGVSRGRIVLIAKGRRPDYEAIRRAKQQEQENPFDTTKPAERCPECGNLVHMPCMICRTRRAMALESRRQCVPESSSGFSNPIQLNLRERHQIRYEEVRAERMQQERNSDEWEVELENADPD